MSAAAPLAVRAGRGRGACGAALVDYLGIVAVVGMLLLALMAVREHTPERRPPIDPVATLARLVSPPPVARRPRTTPAAPRVARAPRPRRPRPAAPARPTVLAPAWAIGP